MSGIPTRLSPDLLAHRYDPSHDAVHFVAADRALRRRIPFLIDENMPDRGDPLVLRRQDALAATARSVGTGTTTPMGFIFHSAYCCSTLLGNAYDRPGRSFRLKEPTLLNDLVGWRHRGGEPARVGEMRRDGLTLLARPFEAGETCIVKPSNVVNGLAAAMIDARPEAGVLLLYAPLDVYLGSIASKGLWGRRWLRDLLFKQLLDGSVDLGFERNDYFLQSDLQVAAVGWLAQHALFARLAKAWPTRVRTLDSETLLARPTEALTALDALFGIAGNGREREALVASVFRRNAKSGEAFGAADRIAGQKNATEQHGEEIATVDAWARAVAETAKVTFALPQPLLA